MKINFVLFKTLFYSKNKLVQADNQFYNQSKQATENQNDTPPMKFSHSLWDFALDLPLPKTIHWMIKV